MSSEVARILTLRHGEGWCGVDGTWGGHAGCRGLSERGVRQAELVSGRIRRDDWLSAPDILVSSRMRRAMETAAIVGRDLSNCHHLHDCRLCEKHPADIEDGKPIARGEAAPAGRESKAMLTARVGEFFEASADDWLGKTVLIVTHSGVIRSMFAALGLTGSRHIAAEPTYTSITEWEYGRSAGGATSWRLRRFNDCAHLTPGDLVDD